MPSSVPMRRQCWTRRGSEKMTPETMIQSTIAEIGGGLPAVALVALAYVAWALWREVKRLHEARMVDMRDANKAHADLSREMSRALDQLANNISQSRRE